MPEGDSFLPRIQSVFYAVFDVKQGARIVYQVPEDLIAVPPPGPFSTANGNGSLPPTPTAETSPHTHTTPLPGGANLVARNSSSSLVSSNSLHRPSGRLLASSPQKSPSSAQRTLFNFSDISKYVIPPSPLCGRLVTCSTQKHRIMGFPVAILGKYDRVYFRYNFCFVFDRDADLSCYEPIVRKVGCVLQACEEESEFLSSPTKSQAVHPILEQLYEDLNSYSETSIQIDQFNSIELKIFPFYPNPPQVKDWMVPLALINLSKRMEENWDLTMLKVCKHVDGVNHVSRIAHLADCDISLARQAVSHLLYYQVIMMIDIFQYSNMYTLRKNIQWLADEAHVREECGPYVTKPGRNISDWPKLLHLYSRLKPGKTILEWMRVYDVDNIGIDVRRFTSFGVVKGFLRRVHRYPVYLPPDTAQPILQQLSSTNQSPYDPVANSELARKRGKNLSNANLRLSAYPPSHMDQPQTGVAFPAPVPDSAHTLVDSPLPAMTPVMSATHRARRASAAEKVLEQLRSRDIQKSGSVALSSPRASWLNFQQHDSVPLSATTATTALVSPTTSTSLSSVSASVSSTITVMPSTTVHDSPTKAPQLGRSEGRRLSLTSPTVPPSSPVLSKMTLAPVRTNRLSRSPSIGQIGQPIIIPTGVPPLQSSIPPDIIPLLDGDHHTDELSVRFEVGWPLLEQWLVIIGAGRGDGDYGRVAIIYR